MLAVLVLAAAWIRRAVSDRRPGDMTDSHRGAAMAHPHDPDKRAEHHALLELMPGADFATHVAAHDGDWSSPGTWASGEIPGQGAIVLIPSGVRVRYTGDRAEHLFIVRVDGTLAIEAPSGTETNMIVDTLFTTPGSVLAIDASGADDGSIEIELRPFDIEAFEARGAPAWGPEARERYSDGARVVDTGADTRKIDELETLDDGPGVLGRYGWDPKQLSIGLIAHGTARIAGKAKRGPAFLEGPARRGANSMRLREAPANWAPGDTVVIAGTRYVGRHWITGAYTGSEDELRHIERIDGNEVVLDRPLEYDHVAPREELALHVANLTRNVRFRSGADLDLRELDADAAGSVASTLAHVMFMHESDVQVSHAAFDDLGRTNKNDVLDDFGRRDYDGLDSGRRWKEMNGRRVPVAIQPDHVTNPRGRYAVHLHRAGATEGDAIARIEGCVVTGGPGWGFVSHDSRVDFLANVAYGVLGAAFVAETGNETGTWRGNLAINTYGADYNSPVLEPRGLWRYENDDFEPTILLEKRGSWKNHDFGHFGDGFWLQGKLIDMVDNTSVNSGLSGYFYMFRAPDQIAVRPELIDEPLSVHDPAGIHPFAPGLNVFTGNRSIADRCGLVMIGLGGGRTNDERTVLADLVAWEVGQIGTYAEYYPGYTIRDSSFLASTSSDAHPTEGVRLHKVQMDTVLASLEVLGFHRAYDLRKSWSPGVRNQQGFDDPYAIIHAAREAGEANPLPLGYAQVLIDAGFTRAEASEGRHMGATYRAEDTLITSDDLAVGRLEIELDDDSLRVDLDNQKITYGWLPDDPVRPTMQEGHVLLLRGTKTDSIGSIPIAYHNNVLVWHAPAVQHRLETEGYYRMSGGRIGVVLEEMFADRYTAEKKVVRFVAELDPRWKLDGVLDRGPFDPAAHPGVYCPRFLRE